MTTVTREKYAKKRAAARRAVLGQEPPAPAVVVKAFNAGYDTASPDAVRPLGWDPDLPNHYYADALGDPATCTGAHNHPEETP